MKGVDCIAKKKKKGKFIVLEGGEGPGKSSFKSEEEVKQEVLAIVKKILAD